MSSRISYSEQELLLRISTGDEQAFRQIFDQYQLRIYSYAYSLTESEDRAGEVVQEVFLKLWANRDKLTHVASFDAWLFRIAKNIFFDAIKKAAKESAALMDLQMNRSGLNNETEDLVLNRENEALLQKALDTLPPQQKRIFQLRRQGLRPDEIAEQLQISKNTVKVHLNRAVSSLKEYFSSHTDTALGLLAILFLKK